MKKDDEVWSEGTKKGFLAGNSAVCSAKGSDITNPYEPGTEEYAGFEEAVEWTLNAVETLREINEAKAARKKRRKP